ncbi:RNA 2'-phosphotransferase [Novacetimonas maltaceti]|uniref:Probable RNA 2'-phosphotransferase n=2 Tax=Novacetimonas maltaceti TaxID=1203393 RepID=A0A2S3W4L9_9PROT|nr:RNA 2'-phosphotransferase [Novacetimonas maltaceti]
MDDMDTHGPRTQRPLTDREIGRFLSLVLRHDPGRIDIRLDPQGWVDTTTLIRQARRHGRTFDLPTLRRVVRDNDKQRFTLSPDGARIRAAQGHSVAVDLALAPAIPPATLWHGTARASLDSIFRDGLVPGRRRHVHLSTDEATAMKVGTRHGRAVVLRVAAERMQDDGLIFWRADNGVWLSGHVPPRYLSFA